MTIDGHNLELFEMTAYILIGKYRVPVLQKLTFADGREFLRATLLRGTMSHEENELGCRLFTRTRYTIYFDHGSVRIIVYFIYIFAYSWRDIKIQIIYMGEE